MPDSESKQDKRIKLMRLSCSVSRVPFQNPRITKKGVTKFLTHGDGSTVFLCLSARTQENRPFVFQN